MTRLVADRSSSNQHHQPIDTIPGRTAADTHRAGGGSGGAKDGAAVAPPPDPSHRSADAQASSPDPAANHGYENPWNPWRVGGRGRGGGDGGFSFPGVRLPGAAGSAVGGGGSGAGDDEGGAEQRRTALSQMLDEDPSERRWEGRSFDGWKKGRSVCSVGDSSLVLRLAPTAHATGHLMKVLLQARRSLSL